MAAGYLPPHAMPRCLTVVSLASLALVTFVIADCHSSTGLPAGLDTNIEDTVSLYALDGTALDLPSGLIIASTPHAVRTDLTADFDFGFNMTGGKAVLLPTGAMHLGVGSGIQKQSVDFDAITLAPGGVYVDSLPDTLDVGTVAVIHSRPLSTGSVTVCLTGIGYFYAKLQVLAIDTLARRIDMKFLADQNCGYKSLEPGNPTQ